MDDGFQDEIFTPDVLENQNLFFLHGAFHIYQRGKFVYKITQKQNKALYDRVEEIINSATEKIVYVLTDTAEDKNEDIQRNEYLKTCFDKLSKIGGCLMIFGSSLANNDKHIFTQINNSPIEKIYLSSSPNNEQKDRDKAKDRFPDKEIILFDYGTVSY